MIKFVLSALLLAVSCAALEITLPEEINVEKGQTATITCDYATTEEEVTLKWYKKAAGGLRQRVMVISNGEMNLDGGYTGRPLASDGEGSLILANVTTDDDREFKNIFCVVEAGVGGGQTETEKATTFSVIVYPTTDPEVELDRGVFEMGGENVVIGACSSGEGHPKPTITFLKNGEIVKNNEESVANVTLTEDGINIMPKEFDPFADFTSNDIATVAADGFSLKMKTTLVAPDLTAADDNAVFTCVAEVNGQTRETNFPPIRVNYPTDTVTVTASANPVNDGDTVTLTCEANGYPAATITSFGEGESSTFDITVSKADNGRKITCYAFNSGNIDPIGSSPYTLNVNYVDVPITSGNIDAELGENLEPTCQVDATASGVETAWYKDGEVVTFPVPASFDHIGTYTCTATADNLPSTSSEITIDVEGLRMLTTDTDAVVTESSSTLSCKAEGIPAPTFEWEKTDKDGVTSNLSEGISSETTGRVVTSTLTLNDIGSSYSDAKITCIAKQGGVEKGRATQTMPEISTGSSAGIIIGILIGLLILAVVLYVLYSRGIICKDNDKEGVEDGNKDIEVGGGEPAPADGTQAEATEEEKAPLTNGDGAQ